MKKKHKIKSIACAAVVLIAPFSSADGYDIYSRTNDISSFTYQASPDDWRDVNMYQLFTDRFFDRRLYQLNEQGYDKNFTPYQAYHPANFYKVEPMFGTFGELKDLIGTAHAEGMYIMLDVVVNTWPTFLNTPTTTATMRGE